MIGVTELQIGNKVFIADVVHEVARITEKGIYYKYNVDKTAYTSRRNVNPIKLNSHQLRKHGFKRYDLSHRYRYLGNTRAFIRDSFLVIDEIDKFIPATIYDGIVFKAYGDPIFYLHQLQNLFYLLNNVKI